MTTNVIVPPMIYQCDPQWKNAQLGFGLDNMCQSGCVLMCVTSLAKLAYPQAQDITPINIDNQLRRSQHYWGETKNLIDVTTVFRDLDMRDIKHRERIVLPRGMTYAKQQIRKNLNYFGVIKIPSGTGFHFMLAYGVNSRNQFLAMDPLYGMGKLRDFWGGDSRLVRVDIYSVN